MILNGRFGNNNMFGNIYNNKKILITGNTGFKGSWLSAWLLSLNAKVYGISKDIPTDPSLFKALLLENKCKHFEEDIRNLPKLLSIIKQVQPDFIFHLAAQPIVKSSFENPIETLTTNIIGTANVLEALRLNDKECVAILITSDKCYDNKEWTWGYRESDNLGGKDPYSASKGGAELVIKTYFQSFFSNNSSKIKVCSARAGNVIGGGDWAKDRIIPDIVRAWSKKEAVVIRSPKATRPWQLVLEPLSGYLRLGQMVFNNSELNGESYNFGPPGNQNHSVEEIIKMMEKYWDSKNDFDKYKIIQNDSFKESMLLKLCCDKALHQLKWEPTLNFIETMQYTAKWYSEYYKGNSDIINLTNTQITDFVESARKKGYLWAME
jgi:CDP-glucose 4,6-dehydratase